MPVWGKGKKRKSQNHKNVVNVKSKLVFLFALLALDTHTACMFIKRNDAAFYRSFSKTQN